jgi:hypothetical protein
MVCSLQRPCFTFQLGRDSLVHDLLGRFDIVQRCDKGLASVSPYMLKIFGRSYFLERSIRIPDIVATIEMCRLAYVLRK